MAKAWTLISQIGLTVICSVFVCVILGIYLDQRFDWYTTVPLLVLGILSGGIRAYRMAKTLVGENDKDDLAGVYDRLQQEDLKCRKK